MELILFLIIFFLNLSKIKTHYVKGKLSKDNSITVKEQNSSVYLETNEFGNNGEICVKVTVHSSKFFETEMFYGGSNNIENSISLTNSKPYAFSSSIESIFDFYYYEFSYYFYIPFTSSQRYLYVSIPNFSTLFSFSYAEINVEINGLSEYTILIIVSAVIAIIDIIVIIIAIIRYRKKNAEIIAPQDE